MLSRRLALASGISFLATASIGQSTEIVQIAGMYDAEGMNADGTKYKGQVAVVQNDDTVQMTWAIGTETFYGVGILEGRVLTVEWGDTTPMVYVVMENELHGIWNNGTAVERLMLR